MKLLLVLFLPMWWALVSTILLSLTVDARPEKATLSNVSGHVLLAEGEPISHFSPMDAQSPGFSLSTLLLSFSVVVQIFFFFNLLFQH